jgi:hypothetical protein
MKSPLPSPDAFDHSSSKEFAAAGIPGVTYRVIQPSLRRRTELTQALAELVQRLEFHEGGAGLRDRCAAAHLASELDSLIVRWGLLSVDGLLIDGEAATPEALIQNGPEGLCREIAGRIREECGLSEAERKN